MTSLLDVNETTCFGLLGHHQVAKFYETKYCCVWQTFRSHYLAKKKLYMRYKLLTRSLYLIYNFFLPDDEI